ncbi:hypothetical protein QJS10_CPA01g00023 [Acorus calamus]|uniref:Calcineurin-like phosphoesterase domain-containing protein n=1 Tax=Acorus calamus TaxID=4465 RepID=A0AAV9FEF6_ACOCL|nr:hypothetical protein QJS10_CPA01g00023 [Acorus calamus]
MEWVKWLSKKRFRNDVLIVAGDVAETYKNFFRTLSALKDPFRKVFYVPGNHDLWCRREGETFVDSLEKLDALLDGCRVIGVETRPQMVEDLGIIPLFSWYHQSFDQEKDVTSVRIPSLEMACKDFHACKWPSELSGKDITLAQYFDVKEGSHCDRQELCPEKRVLFYPNLPKIIGSNLLEDRLRSIHGIHGSAQACHVFGHTHFCWDAMLDGMCKRP